MGRDCEGGRDGRIFAAWSRKGGVAGVIECE